MNLVFSFEDTPYKTEAVSRFTETGKRRRGRPPKPYGQGKSVGGIATEIEDKFHVVKTFYKMEEGSIVANLEREFALATVAGIEKKLWNVTWDPSVLVQRFRNSLNMRRFDGVIAGVPTKASLNTKGKSPRPSFIRTGTYRDSFRVKMEP